MVTVKTAAAARVLKSQEPLSLSVMMHYVA
jgi:hypothetical protein